MLNLRRQNWTPNKASRLCSEHFESCHIGTDSRGRKCLKNTAVPTIFHFPEEKVPGGKCLVVSANEVSDNGMVVLSSGEEVSDVGDGSSAVNLIADHSNVMMEDTPQQAFVAQDVIHDDITLTANAGEDVGLGSSNQPIHQSKNWTALDHCQNSYVLI
nr:THAP domain-containing protein 4-like [Labrus bergylta]